MFGRNKILKAENHSGSALDVQEIFATIQGEGIYAGHPAVFVRLGGCNLACKFCDTEFDSYKNFSLKKIIAEVQKLAKNSAEKRVRNLVVITGGEPLRQPIERLCEELVRLKFTVQIETNGTLFRQLPDAVKIICSPKTTNKKYHKIRGDLLARIDAFKFLISTGNAGNKDYQDVAEFAKNSKIPIYVQPMDEYDAKKNQKNLQLAIRLAAENGYFLSLQLHKILGIR